MERVEDSSEATLNPKSGPSMVCLAEPFLGSDVAFHGRTVVGKRCTAHVLHIW